jgi:hypothetical protein
MAKVKSSKVKEAKVKDVEPVPEAPAPVFEFEVGDWVLVPAKRHYAGGPEQSLAAVTHQRDDGTYDVAVLADEYEYRSAVEL